MEYMMGNYNGYSGFSSKYYDAETAASMGATDGAVGAWNSGYTGKTGLDNETYTERSWPDSKYYDLYTTSDVNTACNGKPCKGHALNEVAGWYGDYSNMVHAWNPWIICGGNWNDGAMAGIFSLYSTNGYAVSYYSFRIVLAP